MLIATPQTPFAIPTNMERFRLETGAPTFIDFKAHPYKDIKVVEWHARLSLADELDGNDPPRACEAATKLHDRYGVTHFVRPSSDRLTSASLVTVFEDDNFAIQQWLWSAPSEHAAEASVVATALDFDGAVVATARVAALEREIWRLWLKGGAPRRAAGSVLTAPPEATMIASFHVQPRTSGLRVSLLYRRFRKG